MHYCCSSLAWPGVDVVACIASNDIFVQSAWGRVLNVEDKILMISDDFNLTWLKAAGLTADCESPWTTPSISITAGPSSGLLQHFLSPSLGRDISTNPSSSVTHTLTRDCAAHFDRLCRWPRYPIVSIRHGTRQPPSDLLGNRICSGGQRLWRRSCSGGP